MASLREQRRIELNNLILSAAWRQLRQQGAAALSLRAVARDVGLTVSALYRYYPSRDDLLTELLVRSFEAQADAVEAAGAREPTPTTAFCAAAVAYRQWALANPAEYTLSNGTPVPGYRAPGERTIRQGTRVGDYLVGLAAQAWRDGLVDEERVRGRYAVAARDGREALSNLADRRGYDIPDVGLAAVTDAFLRLQGFVLMEVFGQLRPIAPDPDPWFANVLDLVVADLGMASLPD